jgi:hypothetical protein
MASAKGYFIAALICFVLAVFQDGWTYRGTGAAPFYFGFRVGWLGLAFCAASIVFK